MAASRRTRSLAAVGALAALIAPLAVVAATGTASAQSPKMHQVDVYKVEKHLTIDGEFPGNEVHEHLSCSAGDIALDGMWRVDTVDEPDPELEVGPNHKGDVYVDASYGDDSDQAKWHFELTNEANASAQLKLFVVCAKRATTKVDNHSHQLSVRSVGVYWTNPAQPAGTWSSTRSYCDSDEFAIAPGFAFLSGSGRSVGSWPTGDYRGWQWRFELREPSEVRTYLRCLKVKTSAAGAGGHVHKLSLSWFGNAQAASAGVWEDLDFGKETERQVSCADTSKAIVGSYWTNHHAKTWWLGMDPRPKTRAFRWLNDDVSPIRVYNSVLCLKVRTSQQLKP